MSRIQPKLKELSKDELKAWEEKLIELQQDSINTYKVRQIKNGRGWIF